MEIETRMQNGDEGHPYANGKNLANTPKAELPGQPYGRNILLIGSMGSGKSIVGRYLSRLAGYGFLDLDERIESKESQTISEIFTRNGEEYFREVETSCLQELKSIRSHVIALGGGAVVRDDNWSFVSKLGVAVWVHVSPFEIARRLVMKHSEISSRPMLQDLVQVESNDERFEKIMQRIQTMTDERAAKYGRAHLKVKNSYATPEETALRIKQELLDSGYIA